MLSQATGPQLSKSEQSCSRFKLCSARQTPMIHSHQMLRRDGRRTSLQLLQRQKNGHEHMLSTSIHNCSEIMIDEWLTPSDERIYVDDGMKHRVEAGGNEVDDVRWQCVFPHDAKVLSGAGLGSSFGS